MGIILNGTTGISTPDVEPTGSTVPTNGLYLPAANSVGIATNSSERVRVNSSGNVGIGTSPNKRLTVYSDDGYIQMLNAQTGTGNTDGSFIGVEGGTTALRIVNQENDAISFHTNGLANERGRFDASGNLLVGTTTQLGSARVTIKTPDGSGSLIPLTLAVGLVSDGYGGISFRNPNGAQGSVAINSTTVTYNTSSDYRLKENIAPMTGALATVAQLKPVTYNWKVDGSAGQGFIAHELQAVVPDCVTGEKDAVDAEGKPQYQGIDTSFLVATLTAAIKEQQALIEQLTTRIAALEAK